MFPKVLAGAEKRFEGLVTHRLAAQLVAAADHGSLREHVAAELQESLCRRERRREMELTFPSANRELKHFDAAARVLNRFHWNVSIEDAEGELRLFGGEVLVGRFKSMAELETFTAGLALALHVLPPEVATMIDEWAGA